MTRRAITLLFLLTLSITVLCDSTISLQISPSVTNTPLYYYSFSSSTVPQSGSITPSVTITPSPTSSLLPSVTPKPSPSPIFQRIGDPTEIVTTFSCTSTQNTCCNDFVNIWASFVRVNNPTLIELVSCTLDSSLEGKTQDIPLIVEYLQYSSTVHTSTEIISDYWIVGGCVEYDPFTDGPCYPDGDSLDSFEWNKVFSIQVKNAYYSPTDFTNSRTTTPFRSPEPSPLPEASANSSQKFHYSLTLIVALFLFFAL